jgi:hypothetical protein
MGKRDWRIKGAGTDRIKITLLTIAEERQAVYIEGYEMIPPKRLAPLSTCRFSN